MKKFHFSQFELDSNTIFVPDQNFLEHIDLRLKRKSDFVPDQNFLEHIDLRLKRKSDTAIDPESKKYKVHDLSLMQDPIPNTIYVPDPNFLKHTDLRLKRKSDTENEIPIKKPCLSQGNEQKKKI